MFLRSQLVSRIPVFRIYFNSVPSTSSMSFLSPANFLLSRRQNHVIASSRPLLARHFGASLVWTKGAREVKGARTNHTFRSNNFRNRGGGPRNPMGDDHILGSFLALGISALMFSYICSMRDVAERDIPELRGAPEVDFSTFVNCLRNGEIKEIKFVNGIRKVVFTLKGGAFLDGKMTTTMVVNYYSSSEQFSKKIRGLDFARSQEVPIEVIDAAGKWGVDFVIFNVSCILIGLCFARCRRMVKKIVFSNK